MYKIPQKRVLNKFKCVRVLSGRDLYSHLGERLPHDRGSIMPRHPATRQDIAESFVLDGFAKYQDKEIPTVPPDIPPAVGPEPDLQD